jgi:DNA polymerase-1
MKIPKFKGRYTTDKKVLEKLPRTPVIDALFKVRKVSKEYGTYVKNIPKYMDIDGRVHATYLLHGTKTGRLASNNPNLQNVPRNPRVRGQYVADKGRRFLEPDLNQAELRVLACLSGDKALCHIYETAGMSLHNEVRADIWGYPKDWSPAYVREQLQKFGLTEETRFGEKGDDRIVEEQKMRAKAVNFGIVYGRTAPSLAEEFDIKADEAQMWINRWFKKFPQAKEFMDKCRNVPVLGQVLVSPFGNKRRFGVVGNERLEAMQNEASNFLPQCSASHCNLHAAMELRELLAEKYDTYSANLVHDSNLIDCPDDDNIVREVAQIAIRKMEEIPSKWGFTRIPFVAEAKMGYRWGSLSSYDPFKEPKKEAA